MHTDVSELETRIQGHLARSVELVRVIAAKGTNINEARLIECHFYAEDEFDASALNKDLERLGFAKLRMNATADHSWNLEMSIIQSPSKTASEEFTRQIASIAARHRAIYDGWGTSL